MKKTIDSAIDALRRGRRFIAQQVWDIEPTGEEERYGWLVRHIRVGLVLVQNLVKDALLLRASALTFATMLSMVPFLAIMFFIFQTFHLDEQLYERLSEWIETRLPANSVTMTVPDAPVVEAGTATGERPAGPEEEGDDFIQRVAGLIFQQVAQQQGETVDGEAYVDPVTEIVEYAKRGSKPENVGLAGLLFIVATAFGLMMNIESSFNTIWGLKRSRSWYRIFSDYLAILLVFPFLLAFVVSIAAVLESEQIRGFLGGASTLALRGTQVGVIWLAFSAMYFLIPNTRVRLRYALFGGLIAGILFALATWGYMRFQFGLARYSLIYATFAQVPVLLMWVYVGWVVLLFGAELTFAYQNEKTFLMERVSQGASYAYREALTLRTIIEICRRFQEGTPGLSVSDAAEQWHVPTRLLNETLDTLEAGRLVVACATEPVTYAPALSPEKMTVGDVREALRESGRDPSSLRNDSCYVPVFARLKEGGRDFYAMTLAELAGDVAATDDTSGC